MSDVTDALERNQIVEVKRPTKVGVRRGWMAAEAIIRERLPLWLRAAGLEIPQLPQVKGFDDLPAILDMLRALPVGEAIHLPPDVRFDGLGLAELTHGPPLRAVETALAHAQYPPAELARLCEVEVELERVLPLLGALAVARHRDLRPDEGFDLGPWEAASDDLAGRLG